MHPFNLHTAIHAIFIFQRLTAVHRRHDAPTSLQHIPLIHVVSLHTFKILTQMMMFFTEPYHLVSVPKPIRSLNGESHGKGVCPVPQIDRVLLWAENCLQQRIPTGLKWTIVKWYAVCFWPRANRLPLLSTRTIFHYFALKFIVMKLLILIIHG